MKIRIHKIIFDNDKETGCNVHSNADSALNELFCRHEAYGYDGPRNEGAMEEWRDTNSLNGGMDRLFMDVESVEVDPLQLIHDKADAILSRGEVEEEETAYLQSAKGYSNTLSATIENSDSLCTALGVKPWLKSEVAGCFYKVEGDALLSWPMLEDGSRGLEIVEVSICPEPEELSKINKHFNAHLKDSDFSGR